MSDEMRPDAHKPATKADLAQLQNSTKADLAQLQSSTKADIGLLRDEFKSEFRAFRTEMREMFRPVMLTLEHHTAELADIRGYLKDKVVTRDEFHSRMDGFAGRVDDFDYSSAKSRARLDEHEKRISALETKRAQKRLQ